MHAALAPLEQVYQIRKQEIVITYSSDELQSIIKYIKNEIAEKGREHAKFYGIVPKKGTHVAVKSVIVTVGPQITDFALENTSIYGIAVGNGNVRFECNTGIVYVLPRPYFG
jgi:hypothetical protein